MLHSKLQNSLLFVTLCLHIHVIAVSDCVPRAYAFAWFCLQSLCSSGAGTLILSRRLQSGTRVHAGNKALSPENVRPGGQVGLRHVAYVSQMLISLSRSWGYFFAGEQSSNQVTARSWVRVPPGASFFGFLLRSQNKELDH